MKKKLHYILQEKPTSVLFSKTKLGRSFRFGARRDRGREDEVSVIVYCVLAKCNLFNEN